MATDKLITRLQAIYLLRALSKEIKLNDISNFLKIDKTLLSKYINFNIMPNYKKSKYIIDKLLRSDFVNTIFNSYIKSLTTFSLILYPDIHYLISINRDFVTFLILDLSKKLLGFRANKILTVEGGGLYVASILSSYLNVDAVVYAIRDKYIHSSYIEYSRPESKIYSGYIALPHYAVHKGDRVIIVDDIIITGDTIKTLLKLLRKIKGTYIITIASLIVISNDVVKMIESESGVKLICEIC